MSASDLLDAGRFSRLARAFSRDGISVVFSGTACCTDGKTIVLPANSNFLRGGDAQILHGMLDHEASHVREELEAERRGTASPMKILQGAATSAERMLMNGFEDIRIERIAGQRWIGVGENLRALNRRASELYRENASKDPGARDPWHDVVSAIIFAAQDQPTDWLPLELYPALDLVSGEIAESRKITTPEQAWQLTQRAYAKLHQYAQEQAQQEKEKSNDEGGGEEEDSSSENGAGSEKVPGEHAEAAQGKESEEKKRQGGIIGGAGALAHDAKSDDVVGYAVQRVEKAAVEDAQQNRRWIPAPEALAQDRVISDAKDTADYVKCRDAVAPQIAGMRSRLLGVLLARAQTFLRGDRERGVLDSAALSGVRTGSRRVFAQRTEAPHVDTAIEVLIDLSGSMSYGMTPGTGAYCAKLMAVALSETLSALGIPYEIAGFRNVDGTVYRPRPEYTRVRPFEFRVFKGWAERLQDCRARYAGITGGGDNSDGEAVMWAARRLAARREDRKILLVVSDGLPVCPAGDAVAGAHLSDVIARVARAGIEVIGLGAGSEHVEKFYSSKNGARCAVINDLNDLAPEVYRIVRDVLLARSNKEAA